MNAEAAAPAAPPEAAAAPAGRVRGRYVAVAGAGAQAPADPAAARVAERRAVERRIEDLARSVAIGMLPTVCALPLLAWAGVAAGAVLEGAPGAAAVLGLGLLAAVPAALAAWATRGGRGGRRPVPWLVALPVPAALALALAPWLAAAAWQPALALLAALLGGVAALAIALRRRKALPFALVPLLAAGALGPAGWVAGAAGAAVVGLAARQRRRRWREHQRRLVELTDRVRALEAERDEAQRRDAEKSRFLGIASHDLRQPVHALGLFAATLQRRLQKTPDEPVARNLVRAVDGLERSFNAVLDISKLDAGAMSARIETFPLRDLFRRLHMQFGGQAELAGLGLRFSPGGKTVTSDAQLLERILGNLIQNAIKHTTRGGIVVVARTTDECVNVEVWDTGCGIPPAELPAIFGEFYQVGGGERDRSHGLGMGLAIVKRLTALLGHRLEVASEPGRGTMFRIGVPRGGLPGMAEELAPADTQPMLPTTPQVVLIVDDEEPIREGLRLLLGEWGYQALTAADLAQAEQAIAELEGRVDLLISDLNLGPGPDGVEVIATVRRLCGLDLPAILVTGDTAPENVARVTQGRDPVLFKPVQPRRLFDAVRAALG